MDERYGEAKKIKLKLLWWNFTKQALLIPWRSERVAAAIVWPSYIGELIFVGQSVKVCGNMFGKNNLRRWPIGEYILRTIVGKTILGESFFLFHSFEICSPTSTVWVLMELMELWPSMGVWNAFQFLLNASSGDHHGGLRGEKTWNLKECDQWTGTIFCDSPTVEMKLDI